MATPLYKKMKDRGTSFYIFPSSSQDLNLANLNTNYKINFTKFALLNLPEQTSGVSTQLTGKFKFDKDEDGPRFYNFQPGGNNDLPTLFSEQLIESLRNYVCNFDSTLRESRINSNTDFYNINEKVTPSEMIFWKWLKKLNIIDLEPALHKIDWDKNLADFDNNNGTGSDFFQKYLWKERDVNYYDCTITQDAGNVPLVTISELAKFKVGDTILLSGITSISLSSNTEYEISSVSYVGSTTELLLNVSYLGEGGGSAPEGSIYLNYMPVINYIGEIQSVSKIQTSRKNVTEITIQIPHHVGKTPTVLFQIENNTNYYPDLEMPILPTEQQEEIVGSENTNSPIRLRPEDYPGTYFGYFDTEDKTYKCESGDKLRYSGNYYGINLSNNIGLDSETYFEKLTDFNSDNIDGLKLDIDKDHYLKMNLPDNNINNFDEFNSAFLDGVPEDFYFNAILWYYDLDDGSGEITTNLLGIEFLNNPNDDDDDCDVNFKRITPYRKLVSNGTQDGNSYMFSLNLSTNIDNDVLPLSYDPTAAYNQFGFDLYQNILQSNALLQENFMSIISGYTNIQEELFELRSLIYSQTDIDTIKSQIENLNELLTLYSTFQFIDSDSAKIQTDFSGSYPTLKFNVVNTKYSNIVDVNISDILNYNDVNSGLSYTIPVSTTNQVLVNIYNNNNDFDDDSTIVLNNDLAYNQNLEIYIRPNLSDKEQYLNINLNYNDGLGTITETNLISNITLPKDLIYYNSLDVTASTYQNSYYNNSNIYSYPKYILSGTTTTFYVKDDIFEANDIVYIDNFYLQSGLTKIDYSGVYEISATTSSITGYSSFEIDFDSSNLTMISKPKVTYYKGMKIDILRISSSTTSAISDRYKITKTLL